MSRTAAKMKSCNIVIKKLAMTPSDAAAYHLRPFVTAARVVHSHSYMYLAACDPVSFHGYHFSSELFRSCSQWPLSSMVTHESCSHVQWSVTETMPGVALKCCPLQHLIVHCSHG